LASHAPPQFNGIFVNSLLKTWALIESFVEVAASGATAFQHRCR
jgi:hypothetical protein